MGEPQADRPQPRHRPRSSAGAGDDIVYGASRGGRTIIDGGPGNDYLQGGGEIATNFITRRLGRSTRSASPATASTACCAGPGDDLVYAYSKDTVRIDCGPGEDTVRIGYNRTVVTRHCEHVSRRYKRR